MTDRLRDRLVRRELHASRSTPTVLVATALALTAAWTGTEAVLSALGRPALLVDPVDVPGALRAAVADSPTVVVSAGVVAAVLGLVLLALTLSPGRRGRHEIVDERVGAVVDDVVIASAAARVARTAGHLGAPQVTAWASRRRVGVELTRTSGVPLDDDAVREAVRDEIDATGYRPRPDVVTRVAEHGRIGS